MLFVIKSINIEKPSINIKIKNNEQIFSQLFFIILEQNDLFKKYIDELSQIPLQYENIITILDKFIEILNSNDINIIKKEYSHHPIYKQYIATLAPNIELCKNIILHINQFIEYINSIENDNNISNFIKNIMHKFIAIINKIFKSINIIIILFHEYYRCYENINIEVVIYILYNILTIENYEQTQQLIKNLLANNINIDQYLPKHSIITEMQNNFDDIRPSSVQPLIDKIPKHAIFEIINVFLNNPTSIHKYIDVITILMTNINQIFNIQLVAYEITDILNIIFNIYIIFLYKLYKNSKDHTYLCNILYIYKIICPDKKDSINIQDIINNENTTTKNDIIYTILTNNNNKLCNVNMEKAIFMLYDFMYEKINISHHHIKTNYLWKNIYVPILILINAGLHISNIYINCESSYLPHHDKEQKQTHTNASTLILGLVAPIFATAMIGVMKYDDKPDSLEVTEDNEIDNEIMKPIIQDLPLLIESY